MLRLFISYSHKDEQLKDELLTHLGALKRQQVIETWHDRKILGGDNINHSIDENLERADIILLLVSPYFIDSNYCYEIELMRAMERNNLGSARVIPVILHPCDWKNTPVGGLLATPKDGTPISTFSNKHEAFLQVTNTIREVATSACTTTPPRKTTTVANQSTPKTFPNSMRSSNLKLKTNLTDYDRDNFLQLSFESIAAFFKNSLEQLRIENSSINTTFRQINANHFTAAIYRHGKIVSQCGIRLDDNFTKQISFAYDSSSTNSYNEALYVMQSEDLLTLRPTMNANRPLNTTESAELFWRMFLRNL